MTKVTTIRIDDQLNDEVNAVARADDVPASEVVRAALYRYIAREQEPPPQRSPGDDGALAARIVEPPTSWVRFTKVG